MTTIPDRTTPDGFDDLATEAAADIHFAREAERIGQPEEAALAYACAAKRFRALAILAEEHHERCMLLDYNPALDRPLANKKRQHDGDVYAARRDS